MMAESRLERFAHNLDWNLLRTFVVVVEEGSITAAANRLLLHRSFEVGLRPVPACRSGSVGGILIGGCG